MGPSFHGMLFAGGGGVSLMQIIQSLGLTSGLKIVLDAGDANSYTSGQKWLDLSGNGYDFFLGLDETAASDDPTFNGTPGGLSASEYWSFDGNDLFLYDSPQEVWMENLHRNNAKFSILCAGRSPSGDARIRAVGTNSSLQQNGIVFGTLANEGIFIKVQATTVTVLAKDSDGTIDLVADAWHIFGISLDEAAGGGGSFFFGDGATLTFNGTYSTANTGSGGKMRIGAHDGGTLPALSGTRIACLAMWEGVVLTTTQMHSIYSVLRGRFGI
jgi:hypothetical protein